jgi:signal transduction histidine kinase
VEAAEAGRVVEGEAARLERLVQDLLDLSRLNRRSFAIRSLTAAPGHANGPLDRVAGP